MLQLLQIDLCSTRNTICSYLHHNASMQPSKRLPARDSPTVQLIAIYKTFIYSLKPLHMNYCLRNNAIPGGNSNTLRLLVAKQLTLLTGFMFLCLCVFAQQKTVTGTVTG